jgi:hypothetical protein
MSSSTSRHGSFDPGLLTILFAGIVGAPLLWLTALQSGYVLAYQACDDRSTSWVIVPTFAFVVIVGVVAALSARGHRRAEGARTPMPFLGWVAVGTAGLMLVVMVATAITPLFMHPCD